MYQRFRGANRIDWVDVSLAAVRVTPDLTRAAALSRLHARRSNGELISGAVAFSHIWSVLESFKLLGRITRWPLIAPVAEIAYRGFLKVRPRLQSLFKSYVGRD